MKYFICGVFLLLIAGCGGENSVQPPVIEQPVIEPPVIEQPVIEQPVIEQPVVHLPVVEPPVVEPPVIEPPVVEPPVRTFKLISQHYGVLLGTGQIAGEVVISAQVITAATIGSDAVETAQADSFVPGELIVLLGAEGNYHTETIAAIEPAMIVLSRPLQYQVEAGATLWNFYVNYSHPTLVGYYAIADYATAEVGNIAEGTHVFLGDSWFSNAYIMNRIKQEASSSTIFINSGVGGHTVQDLLNRFDADVLPHQPTHVWVMAGTNDYFRKILPTIYAERMQTLIDRIEGIGAQAIVFDASVGPQSYGSDQNFELKILSDQYVAGFLENVW